MTTTETSTTGREFEAALLDAAFPVACELPRVDVIEQYVMPHILNVRDDGTGNLAQLPLIGSESWHRASDAVKWATVAVAAMQGLWAAERGPAERVAYSEGMDRVEMGLDWGAYAYTEGYEKGRRDQAAMDRRIRSGAQRREQKAA